MVVRRVITSNNWRLGGRMSLPESAEGQLVNQELREVLEPYDGFERWLECARRGTRCANDGQCLLIDYKVTGDMLSPGASLSDMVATRAIMPCCLTLFKS